MTNTDRLVNPNDYQLIFDALNRKMNTVAFASGSGTNFREAILDSKLGDPERNFTIDLLVTDKEKKDGKVIGAINYANDYGIDVRTVNGFKYCGSWKEAQKSVEGLKKYEKQSQIFNGKLYYVVRKFEEVKNTTFDLAVLAGYMRFFKGGLLRRFNKRAINIHPARLDIFNGDGVRKYIGDNAVYDALKNGETRTRSSIILVDPDADAGAILVSGPWIDYTGKKPATQEDADSHQKLQKEKSDYVALRFALNAIADGEIGLHKHLYHPDGNPVVVYKRKIMPYCGVELGGE